MALGLNRFTGLEKTPTELAWLIRQHQRLVDEVARASEVFEDRGRKAGARGLELLREQLRCVDVVIALHPAGFDPKAIPSLRRKAQRLYAYGVVSRDYLNLLWRREGKPMSTAHIARTITKARGLVLDGHDPPAEPQGRAVQLNALRKTGLVEVLPAAAQQDERYWRLKASQG
jgi:hypothetical protein